MERTLTSYLIRLRGRQDPELALWLPELSLTHESDGNTLLRGELPDQSALLGILFRVHNLNLQILSVCIKKSQSSEILQLPHQNA